METGTKVKREKKIKIGNIFLDKLPNQVKIDEMTLIGRMTHLFWGYDIVDRDGRCIRKFGFVEKYPEEASIVDELIYPMIHNLSKEDESIFRKIQLEPLLYQSIGFRIKKRNLK